MTAWVRPVDVARQFRRSPDWLRAMERRGLIPPARRDHRGFRFYEPEDIAEIRRIVLKQDSGEKEEVAVG